eukprot:m.105468 g.105468  ORF g.105468 m.105468 type:complete len:519 (-) comp13279_c0_seq19:1205-2761(-)
MSNDAKYESAARHAMQELWSRRSQNSDLVGTTINIMSGQWTRKDATVGAGVDSYYEYLLKAYMMLGEQTYLDVFNTHYSSILLYLKRGPYLVTSHISNPTSTASVYMDALQTFFPGLQVLKGDLESAIETHRMYYEIIQRHGMIPEAFTADFRVNWAQSPLRPEFVESTYYLYQATRDPIYLEIGVELIKNLEKYNKVPCGWAAITDVRTMNKEDKMDSFVLTETFKYLYLLFSEEEDIPVALEDYVFTTEAHPLPLSLASKKLELTPFQSHSYTEQHHHDTTCPNIQVQETNFLRLLDIHIGHHQPICRIYSKSLPRASASSSKAQAGRPQPKPISAREFNHQNQQHMEYLHSVGVSIVVEDGQIKLLQHHNPDGTVDPRGSAFMQEMIALVAEQNAAQDDQAPPAFVTFRLEEGEESHTIEAGSAMFGPPISSNSVVVQGMLKVDASISLSQSTVCIDRLWYASCTHPFTYIYCCVWDLPFRFSCCQFVFLWIVVWLPCHSIHDWFRSWLNGSQLH